MSLPLVIIRGEPSASRTLAAARDAGIDARAFPLFEAQALPWEPADPARYDALLIGSANAVRHGGSALADLKRLPVYAVGQATAAAAREAGFDIAHVGSGGLQNVLDRLGSEPPLRLLRLAGEKHVPLTPPARTRMDTRIVYRIDDKPFPSALTGMLKDGAVAALHSAEAALHFRSECERAELDLSRIALFVIGPRVAAAAGPGWASVNSASTPDDTALLALAQGMCQTAA
ncbi:uroporphyrinogen-III synthase [Qipengyuania atrilutea]|uniref:Uroporphyrinogen-III synthase n=1 Tax=Qipengyuania atrilutea TaxID=2744473 RepID=A0A850H8Z6_9SPHN|nr:uroporphyrinogen-III synthase [Actirhodobacter atriluteus]NVD43559.1 uroporphyrinogen-III synthase [Actirhodobacter atriluteus]